MRSHGHGRLGRVETGLLSRAIPIGTKGADRSTQERRAVPLSWSPKASGFWYHAKSNLLFVELANLSPRQARQKPKNSSFVITVAQWLFLG